MLTIIFLISYALIFVVAHEFIDRMVINHAEEQAQSFLLSYKSVRKLVSEWHKPEIYRLQEENKLYKDYFSPYLLSTTFNARGFMGFLNDELNEAKYPQFIFKVSSDNAINAINEATEKEQKLLQSFRQNEMVEHKSIEHDNQYGELLSYSVPTRPVEKKCLRCHGDPKDAPKELINIYGDVKGFNESIGNIRALINLKIPLQMYYQNGHRVLAVLMISLAFVFLLVYWMIRSFYKKIEKQNFIIFEQSEKLKVLSRMDKLTNLLNRHGFEEDVEPVLKIAQRYKEELTLIMFDIDFFKKVNDTYGHNMGDIVLQKTAEVTKGIIRSSDLFCRWGGEEFIILLPKTGIDKATILAERIRLALAKQKYESDGQAFTVTSSFGISQFLDKCSTLENLIGNADQLLYIAKNRGRNRVEIDLDVIKNEP